MSTMDMSQYLGVFVDEGREQVGVLEAGVLRLEEGAGSPEILQEIFRAAHTLKGSSRTMGFTCLGELTHRMESVLDGLRSGAILLGPQIVNVLLESTDCLSALLEEVASNGAESPALGANMPALFARLESASLPAEAQSIEDPSPPETHTSSDVPEFDEDECVPIDAAVDSGRAVVRVDVELCTDCLMKSVRVQMVFGVLERLGLVLAASPARDLLDDEQFGERFAIAVATDAEFGQIEKALGTISEIVSFSVAAWDDGLADCTDESVPDAVAVCDDAPRTAESDPAPSSAPNQHTQTVRVEVGKLDKLLNLVGELVIDRTMLERACTAARERHPRDEHVGQIGEGIHRIARITAELQDEIMKTRMLPIEGVFQRMPRMVRDLAQKTGKLVDLQIVGGETELDRSMIEVLADPLIHLLRNCVDHGIESPGERAAADKPPSGAVILSARHEENHIIIEIFDDGRGIDPERMRQIAVAKGLISRSAADTMSDRDAVHLIFLSGFSSADVVSDISGRGVGMDIVRSNIEKLGGRIQVDSRVGIGSQFTMTLPLTLAIVRALIVSTECGTYVLPMAGIVEMLSLRDAAGKSLVRSAVGSAMMVVRGRTVPLASLAAVLEGDPKAGSVERVAGSLHVVVVGWGDKQVGLCVDELLGEHEVVIKSLGAFFGEMRGLTGATILGDGTVALIIDAARAIESVMEVSHSAGEANG